MTDNGSNCYQCDATATAQRHIPPLCLLSEPENQRGADYYADLITVPACDRHCSTPHNDRVLLAALAAASDTGASNPLPAHIRNIVRQEATRPLSSAQENPSSACSTHPDEVLEQYARALYFHECGKKITGRAVVKTGFFHHPGEDIARKETAIVEIIRYFSHHEQKGNHSELFSYCFMQDNRSATFLMRFYTDHVTVVFFIK